MFNLDAAIANWRQQMLAAGIRAPELLDELECHLRDDVEQLVRSGLSEPAAFAQTVRQVGRAETLRGEFAKVRGPLLERLKRTCLAGLGLSSLSNCQLVSTMNISNQNLERAWATYLKSCALAGPALMVWMGFCVFILPKLKEICGLAHLELWRPIATALQISDVVRCNLLLLLVLGLAALVWLEWRSHRWPRYRRLTFVTLAYVMNISVLLLITTVAVLGVAAATRLMPGR